MADASKTLEIVIAARDEATKVLQNVGGKFSDLSTKATQAGLLLGGVGAATAVMAKGFVEAAGKMEATKVAFNVLIGDAALAEKTLKQLYDLESKTPFTLESIMTESKKLVAMGTDAKDLTKTLTMLGDVASGVGFEKLPQLTLAFGQIQAKGRLMGTELRQLTEAGFNLADAMGVSNAKLEEMIANKEVSFEMVRAAFEKVTAEGGRFHGMMDSLSKTTPGLLSTMESSIFKLNAAFGEALLPTVNKLLLALIPMAESFAAFAKEHPNLILGLVTIGLALGVIGTFLVAIVPFVIGLTATLSLLGMMFTFVTGTIGVLVAVLGGPLTIALGAIIAVGALLRAAWTHNWFDIQGKTKTVVDWFMGTAWPVIRSAGNFIIGIIAHVASSWISKFDSIRSAVMSVVSAIQSVISTAQEMANKVRGGLKIPGFQHGGFVPGGFDQAVPAILHGGERVVPRIGTDVNGGGGGGVNLSLNFSGPVSMDSESRVQDLADQIINILGRQSELASKGLAI